MTGARGGGNGYTGMLHLRALDGSAMIHVLWAAIGFGVRGEIEPFRRFSLGVEVGATLPLARDRFYFDPDGLTAHRVDPIGFRGALFVGGHFL